MMQCHRIDGVMDNVLASNAVDRGFEPLSGETKVYNICIFSFSFKYTSLRRYFKDWLARIQDNVSECDDMSARAMLFFSELALYKAN